MGMIWVAYRRDGSAVCELLDDPEQIDELLESDDDETSVDIDKAWHGIHYLLTKSDWEGEPPLNFIVGGGAQVGEVDVGYGPARAFTSEQVKEIAHALAPLTREQLATRFDGADMTRLQIYPTIWDRDPADDDTLGYLLDHYEALRAFIGTAAAERQALVIWLN